MLISATLAPVLCRLEELQLLIKSERLSCNEAFVEIGTRLAAQRDDFQHLIEIAQSLLPLSTSVRYTYPVSAIRCIRELRFGIYSHNASHAKKCLELGKQRFPREFANADLYARVCNNPFDSTWFRNLPLEIQAVALREIVLRSILRLEPIDAVVDLLKDYCDADWNGYGDKFHQLLGTSLLVMGRIDDVIHHNIRVGNTPGYYENKGGVNFLTGQYNNAIEDFQIAMSVTTNADAVQQPLSDFSKVFLALCLLKIGEASAMAKVQQLIDEAGCKQSRFLASYSAIEALMLAQQNRLSEARSILYSPISPTEDSLSILLSSLVKFWVFPEESHIKVNELKQCFENAIKNGYEWFALEFAALLSRSDRHPKKYKEYAENVHHTTGMRSIVGLVRHEEPWERVLRALSLLESDQTKNPSSTSISRLIWLVKFDGIYSCSPRLQVKNVDGEWTKGRRVALKRLKTGTLECMTPQDHRICSAIEMEYGYYGKLIYHFDYERAIPEMVGHPLLFLEDSPTTAVELVRVEPELYVEQKGKNFEIRFTTEVMAEGLHVYKETPAQYKVVQITPQHRKVADTLGTMPLKIPVSAKAPLSKAIANVASMITVHSPIDGRSPSVENVLADSRCCFHVLPIDTGFKVELFIKPFRKGGPYFKPGQGEKHVIAEIDGKRIQTKRDLKQETKNASRAIAMSSVLFNTEHSDMVWFLSNPEACLQVLLDLKDLGNEITMEWHGGKRLRVHAVASFDRLSLKLRRDNEWFTVSGELQLDHSRVIELIKLLEFVESTKSRFVPLGDGDFIALTNELRQRLEEFNGYSVKAKTGVRLHYSAVPAVQGFTEQLKKIDKDAEWTKQINRIKRSLSASISLPSTLQARLRDYQVEGFNWLARLARWGVGACLADDMGLGKTLQALAIILERAAKGPALVVAPTSVCMNWLQEAGRYAPTLNPQIFGGKSREKLLRHTKPFDVIICSYGLLHQEAENVQNIVWETIVLDEAQAIKNIATRRSRAAMNLQGRFKMITTGTPIENHLGELWSLFRFINPGLLGSAKQFNQKFAVPIERDRDTEAKKRLKNLIMPFILRRTKSEVLDELPPKTEIVLSIEMSADEMAFYEAVRQRALENIATMDADLGQSRLTILAEIMKLRRACCHPRLIVKDSSITSAKLSAFIAVLTDLLDNHHKALVFSQFVDYLTIIRHTVEKMGIPYQYLDGSTPTRQRQKRVKAFQSGEGELFLISLKAGGLGLNLTAADYVIHMDPWWNPSVEDQASDRVHRIGQQHPVTIYKLITRNTIEDKIVNLHSTKRELADSLLTGSDLTGKISADELLRLIQNQ